MDHARSPQPDASTRNRDAALRTLTRLRRGLAVGCVALIGGLAAFVAQAKPGKSSSLPSQSRVHVGAQAATSNQTARPSSAPPPSLSPPPEAPASAPAAPAPPVVSGGS